MNKIGIRIIVNIGRNDQILHIKREVVEGHLRDYREQKQPYHLFLYLSISLLTVRREQPSLMAARFLVAIRFNKFFNNFIFF